MVDAFSQRRPKRQIDEITTTVENHEMDEESSLKRIRLERKLETTDDTFIIIDQVGKKHYSFKVPSDKRLDTPGGVIHEAIDACHKYLPPIKGLYDVFVASCRYVDTTIKLKIELKLQMLKVSDIFNTDNPGHLLLLLRGTTVIPEDVSIIHAAYISALMTCVCKGDIQRLLWIHAGICKVLGSAYGHSISTPITELTKRTVDPISILCDIVVAACPTVFGKTANRIITEEERNGIMKQLRYWHAPKFARDYNSEGYKWSFDRPAHRAEAIEKSRRFTI